MLSNHYPPEFLKGNPVLHLGLGAALSWQDPAAASGESPAAECGAGAAQSLEPLRQ